MKKIIVRIAALLLVLILGLCAVSCKQDDAPEGMQLASGELDKFDLFVPEMWTVTESPTGAYVSSGDRSNVTVTALFPDTVMSAGEYWENVCVPDYTAELEGFLKIEEKDTTLGGKDAKQYDFSYTVGSTAYRCRQVIAVNGNLIYTLTYTAVTDRYDTHLEDVEAIRAAFRFR